MSNTGVITISDFKIHYTVKNKNSMVLVKRGLDCLPNKPEALT
jgi:hypothetical protein